MSNITMRKLWFKMSGGVSEKCNGCNISRERLIRKGSCSLKMKSVISNG